MSTDDIITLAYFGVSLILSLWYAVPRMIDSLEPDEDDLKGCRSFCIFVGVLLSPVIGGLLLLITPLYYLVPKSKIEKKLLLDRREKELRSREQEIERMERELGVGG